jgi:SAM-dependent methyltransferase
LLAAMQAPGIVFPLLRDLGSCLVCASAGLRPLHIWTNRTREITNALRLAFVGCETCGVAFLHPLPTEAQLDDYYASGYRLESAPRPNAKLVQKLALKRANAALHLATLEKSVGPLDGRQHAFDFGCGLGAWLDVLQDRGWHTYGHEPGPRARAVAAQHHAMLDAIPDEPAFDLVVANHVLEHLRDPLAAVRALASATNLGGHIYVSVPDLGRLHEHRSFSYVTNERHIFSFTTSALRSLFALTGFELVAHSNDVAWPDGPIDKNDAKRLKAVGRRVDREIPLPSSPLDEVIDTMLRFEPYSAVRILEEEGGQVRASRR